MATVPAPGDRWKKDSTMTTSRLPRRSRLRSTRVFEVFTDLEHGAERVSNIREIELLTTGGFALGTRWLETREVLGQLDSAEMEVTAFERNRTYTITHHKAGTRIDTVFTFEPFEDGTKVRIEFSAREPRASSRVAGTAGVGHRRQGAATSSAVTSRTSRSHMEKRPA